MTRSFSTSIALGALLLTPLGASAATQCKCLSGQSCFPNSSTWQSFAKGLTGNLITNQRPLAAPCFSSDPSYSASLCKTLNASHTDPTFIARVPNALQEADWEEVYNGSTVQHCPFEPAPKNGATCNQGRVPQYVVNATSVSDIQNAVKFVSAHNLKVVVKNTGHDYLGRAFGTGAVEIYTGNFQNRTYSSSFKPKGAPSSYAGQTAVTVGAGASAGNMLTLAHENGGYVTVGSSPNGTVGAAGGWPLGAGHSIFSGHIGLGVDNVIELDVVLPNGTFVTANAFQNQDLYWAIRGGGGPSFGISTSLTYLTHKEAPTSTAVFVSTANSSAAYTSLLTTWIQHHNAIADAGWGGPWIYFDNQLYFTLSTPMDTTKGNNTGNSTIESFYSDAKKLAGVNVSQATAVLFKSPYDYNYNIFDHPIPNLGFDFGGGAFVGGTRGVSPGWLMSRNSTSPANAAKLAAVMANTTAVGVPFMDFGRYPNASANPSSVNPAARTSISGFTFTLTWNSTTSAQEVNAIKQSVSDQINPYRAMSPVSQGGGQYLNEPDALYKDWANANWGSNYARLLSIKKAIDPKDVFIVTQGVNSEQWDQNVVCKTT